MSTQTETTLTLRELAEALIALGGVGNVTTGKVLRGCANNPTERWAIPSAIQNLIPLSGGITLAASPALPASLREEATRWLALLRAEIAARRQPNPDTLGWGESVPWGVPEDDR